MTTGLVDSTRLALLSLLISLSLLACRVHGQFTTVLNIPPGPDIGDNQSIGSYTQLNLGEGGAIGEDFGAGIVGESNINVELNIFGGTVGQYFSAFDGSVVNISGGTIGDNSHAYSGSTVNVSGGVIDYAFVSYGGSTVNVSGGEFLDLFRVRSGGNVNISGGSIGDRFDAQGGSVVDVSGGVFGEQFSAASGSVVNISGGSFGEQFSANSGSSLNLFGGEFRLDGALIAGLETIGDTLAFNLPTGSLLSGTFADGTPFTFTELDLDTISDGTLRLNAAALPAVDPALIVLPGDPVPLGVRAGQIIVVDDFGVVGHSFSAGLGSTVVLAGGQIGNDFEAVGAQVYVSSGSIGDDLDAFVGSEINISGGTVGDNVESFSGSTVNLSGGSVGSDFQTKGGSSLNISGGDFRLDGTLINGLEAEGNTVALNLPVGSVLSGTLADGTPIAFSDLDFDGISDGTLTLSAVGLPAIGPSLIMVPSDPAPSGVRAGQTMVVAEGGVVGDNFNAGLGSTVDVAGGEIGKNLEAVDAHVSISSGSIGDNLDAMSGSTVNVSGGVVGDELQAYNGSTINLSGGVVGERFAALGDSTVNISGGAVGDQFESNTSSILNISGGEFRLDGTLIGGLEAAGDTLALDLPDDSVLSGTLADGTPFAFTSWDNDAISDGTLRLTATALPAIGPTQIAVPTDPVPLGIRSGQTMVVAEGGVVGANFSAGRASTTIVAGGQLGQNFEAVGAQVTLASGSIGNYFDAYDDSTVNIFGGTVGAYFQAKDSTVNLSGGTFGHRFTANHSTLNLSGGQIYTGLSAFNGSVVNFSGTVIDGHFSFFQASSSIVNISEGVIDASFHFYVDDSVVNISGGTVIGRHLSLRDNSVVNISGGLVGFSIWSLENSTVNISGGEVGVGRLLGGGTGNSINISGGKVGYGFTAEIGTTVNISGGIVGDDFTTSGGTVNISGGSIGTDFLAMGSSVVNISGGGFGDKLVALSSSNLNLAGGEFRLDGTPISGLENLGDTLALDLPDDSVLSGTLADGTPFAFSKLDLDRIYRGSLTLNVAPVPAVGSAMITVPTDPAPLGIRTGQTMVVGEGGIVGDHFNAGQGSTVNVSGGQVGKNLEAVDAQVSITSGSVGDDLDTFGSSTVNISGGTIGANFQAHNGSMINISGGSIGEKFAVVGGTVSISGGTIAKQFTADDGSAMSIAGGTFGDSLQIKGGSSLDISGGEFHLDGTPISGLDSLGETETLTVPYDSVLSGTLADGTPFAFSNLDGDSINSFPLTLAAAPLPAIGPHLIVASSDPVPLGIRTGQTIVVDEGGELGDNFNAGLGSIVEIAGGQVGENLEAVGAQVSISSGTVAHGLDAFNNSTLNVTGGTTSSIYADRSTVNISAGAVGFYFTANNGSTVNISGGNLSRLEVENGSTVHFSGGTFQYSIDAESGSTVNISGGSIGNGFRARSSSIVNMSGGSIGDDVVAYSGSEVNLMGTQFVLDGADITSLLTENVPFTITNRNVTLSGLLADGSLFDFDLTSEYILNAEHFHRDALLTITLTEPGDFNGDLNVNGHDFLRWQQGASPNPLSQSDLDDWQTNYGMVAPLASASVAVPEPSALLLGAIAGFMGILIRRR